MGVSRETWGAEFERGLRALAMLAIEHERPRDPARRQVLFERAFPALRFEWRDGRPENPEQADLLR